MGGGRPGALGPQVFPVPVLQKMCVLGLGGKYRLYFIFIFIFILACLELYAFEFYSVYIVSIIDSCVRRRSSILCYNVGYCCDNVHLMRRCR